MDDGKPGGLEYREGSGSELFVTQGVPPPRESLDGPGTVRAGKVDGTSEEEAGESASPHLGIDEQTGDGVDAFARTRKARQLPIHPLVVQLGQAGNRGHFGPTRGSVIAEHRYHAAHLGRPDAEGRGHLGRVGFGLERRAREPGVRVTAEMPVAAVTGGA